MNLKDLAYSNTLYAYRLISKCDCTIDDISKSIESSKIGTIKTINKLVENNFVIKHNMKENNIGRPKVCYSINPNFFCSIVIPDKTHYIVLDITTDGRIIRSFKFAKNYSGLDDDNTLSTLCGKIGTNNIMSLGIYLIADESNFAKNVKYITNIYLEDLLSSAFSDEEKVVILELPNKKAIINHGKFKYIDSSYTTEVISTIVDINILHDFSKISINDLIAYLSRFFAIKQLEKRISQILD